MSKPGEPNGFGAALLDLMKERSMSMRKLSGLTGIDTATISRIVNGKQQPKPGHLQQLAGPLGVPAERLFKAAGFAGGSRDEQRNSEFEASVHAIQEVLAASNMFDPRNTLELIRKELAKYEQYAATAEGQRLIRSEFAAKVQAVNGAGPFIDKLQQWHARFCEDSDSREKHAVIGSALLYFILSADIIPDYVFPFGYLDDAIAVQLVLDRLAAMDGTNGGTVDGQTNSTDE